MESEQILRLLQTFRLPKVRNSADKVGVISESTDLYVRIDGFRAMHIQVIGCPLPDARDQILTDGNAATNDDPLWIEAD